MTKLKRIFREQKGLASLVIISTGILAIGAIMNKKKFGLNPENTSHNKMPDQTNKYANIDHKIFKDFY